MTASQDWERFELACYYDLHDDSASDVDDVGRCSTIGLLGSVYTCVYESEMSDPVSPGGTDTRSLPHNEEECRCYGVCFQEHSVSRDLVYIFIVA